MTRRRRVGAVAIVLLVFALPGCTGAPAGSNADRVERGIPAEWSGPPPDLITGGPVVGWVDDDEFGVITMGSGSCPPVAGEPEVVSSSELRIEFGPSPNDPCTADLSATTHVFELPTEVTERPVTVTVAFRGGDEEFALELP